MPACGYVHIVVRESLQLELQAVVSHSKWFLGNKLWSFAREAQAVLLTAESSLQCLQGHKQLIVVMTVAVCTHSCTHACVSVHMRVQHTHTQSVSHQPVFYICGSCSFSLDATNNR